MITIRGAFWVLTDAHTHRWLLVILPLAVVLGWLKGTAVLSKAAARAVARIGGLAERTPFWHLYSPAMYLLVAGMMALGIACRWAGNRWHFTGIVGSLYLVIGVALIVGSFAYRPTGEVG